ncbi:MAG: hypothetical protein ACUVQZ_05505 [Candidatus Caldatribacteriaceae bacterium]
MKSLFSKIFWTVMIGVVIGWVTLSFAQPRVFLRFNLNPQIYISIPRSPQVTISVDRGEGGQYFVGDRIHITYRTTREGYVNLIDYFPNGDVRLILRNVPVQGGVTGEYVIAASSPGGTERMVILFTPSPVDDMKLKDFIQAPHQGVRIFGGRYATDKISFQVISRVERTKLIIEPELVEISTSRSLVFTATLQTADGKPLEGKELFWSTSNGSMSSSRTITDIQGQSRNTFSAPSFSDTVTIEVSFPGDIRLSPAQAIATVEVKTRPSSVNLSVSPSSFTVDAEGSLVLTAILADSRGRPIPSQALRWTVNVGTVSQRTTTTDVSGRASISYFAPSVTETTPVEITVDFLGTKEFSPASAVASGEIMPIQAYPLSTTLFYVDFGGKNLRHNVNKLNYKGNLVSGLGFGVNETSFLEMWGQNALEFAFNPGGFPNEGVILLWIQGDVGARARVILNGRRLGSFPVEEGTLSPTEERKIILSAENFVEGINVLRIEPDSPNRRIRLQKVVIVF